MIYSASATISIVQKINKLGKQGWNAIKEDSIKYKWRQIGNHIIQVIGFGFDDPYKALKQAKTMYVKLVFEVLENDYEIDTAGCEYQYEPINSFIESTDKYPKEAYFFHDEKSLSLRIGCAVLETENEEDIEKYQFEETDRTFSVSATHYIDFASLDGGSIEYSREFQKILALMIKANNSFSPNRQMEMYCSIIELLADKAKRSPAAIEEIDLLIQHVNDSALDKGEKEQLVNYLMNGKNQSSRNAGKLFIKKYGASTYCGISATKIWDDAYSMRSQSAHEGIEYPSKMKASVWMKKLVTDVVINYFSQNINY